WEADGRSSCRYAPLDLVVCEQHACSSIDCYHLPWTKTALLGYAVGGQSYDASLRSDNDQSVPGDRVPGRAQSIAVYSRTNDLSVSERYGCASIPWCGKTRSVVVEGS